jgi:hypothetical protein
VRQAKLGDFHEWNGLAVLLPYRQAMLGWGDERSTAMSAKFSSAIATMGIDIGKNSFHLIGLPARPQADDNARGCGQWPFQSRVYPPAARALTKRHVHHGVKAATMIAFLSIPTDRDREEQNAQLLDASQAFR